MHHLRRAAELFELCRRRRGVFLDAKAVSPVAHALGRAGISDHHSRRTAGCGLAHDKAVRVERRREEKQVGSAIPRADDLAVRDRTCEKAAVGELLLFRIAADLRAVCALADKHHAEVDIFLAQRFQRI